MIHHRSEIVKRLRNARINDGGVDMKLCLITVAALLLNQAANSQALLSPRFRTVYIVSMSNSIDEYLASRLTSSRVLWVVLQPSSADAVLTDTLDENFWNWLDHSYSSAGSAPADDRDAAYRRTPSAFNTHSGTIFLVDPRRKVVLWSVYDLPKNSSPAELDRTASRVVSRLKSAFEKK